MNRKTEMRPTFLYDDRKPENQTRTSEKSLKSMLVDISRLNLKRLTIEQRRKRETPASSKSTAKTSLLNSDKRTVREPKANKQGQVC